jgi:D-tyrosyl-tRNA(Tyr) deacylase
MIALLQRVALAHVSVGGQEIARIGRGLTVFIAVEHSDVPVCADRLARRLVDLRVFSDEAGRMNLSLLDVGGALLLVPQFTLAADTRRGNRPSFDRAAAPALGRDLFEALRCAIAARGIQVETGRFGADMQVTLTNDGPVTLWLQVGF